jgi:hypothetical protein
VRPAVKLALVSAGSAVAGGGLFDAGFNGTSFAFMIVAIAAAFGISVVTDATS